MGKSFDGQLSVTGRVGSALNSHAVDPGSIPGQNTWLVQVLDSRVIEALMFWESYWGITKLLDLWTKKE